MYHKNRQDIFLSQVGHVVADQESSETSQIYKKNAAFHCFEVQNNLQIESNEIHGS